MEGKQDDKEAPVKDNYEFKKQKKLDEQKKLQQSRIIKKVFKWILIVLILAGVVGGLVWFIKSQPSIPSSEIITENGIHWHPVISIFIKGQRQTIPANIGLGGGTESPIHTHDDSGTIHMEFAGVVTKSDTKLGNFFKVWNKQFNSNCIFNYCNGPDGHVKMFVNGQENHDFENYPMKDGDRIEIRYE